VWTALQILHPWLINLIVIVISALLVLVQTVSQPALTLSFSTQSMVNANVKVATSLILILVYPTARQDNNGMVQLVSVLMAKPYTEHAKLVQVVHCLTQ